MKLMLVAAAGLMVAPTGIVALMGQIPTRAGLQGPPGLTLKESRVIPDNPRAYPEWLHRTTNPAPETHVDTLYVDVYVCAQMNADEHIWCCVGSNQPGPLCEEVSPGQIPQCGYYGFDWTQTYTGALSCSVYGVPFGETIYIGRSADTAALVGAFMVKPTLQSQENCYWTFFTRVRGTGEP
jgi:hypothetical protein